MSLSNPVLSSDSTGNVKFMYIQLFQIPCSVMYDPNPIHKHEAICLQISSGFVNLKIDIQKKVQNKISVFSFGFCENKMVEIGQTKTLKLPTEGKLHFEKDSLGK